MPFAIIPKCCLWLGLILAKVLFCFLLGSIEPVALDADTAFGAYELDGVEAIIEAAHDSLPDPNTGDNKIDCLANLYSIGWRLLFHVFSVEHAASIFK